MTTHHCFRCNLAFASTNELAWHLRKDHGLDTPTTLSELRHVATEHPWTAENAPTGLNANRCTVCSLVFPSAGEVLRHMGDEHSAPLPPART